MADDLPDHTIQFLMIFDHFALKFNNNEKSLMNVFSKMLGTVRLIRFLYQFAVYCIFSFGIFHEMFNSMSDRYVAALNIFRNEILILMHLG
jgi:hypothetical protein